MDDVSAVSRDHNVRTRAESGVGPKSFSDLHHLGAITGGQQVGCDEKNVNLQEREQEHISERCESS